MPRAWTPIALAALTGACTVPPATPSSAATPKPRTPPRDEAADAPTPPAADGASACDWASGKTTVTVTVDGTPRRFVRWVGPEAGAKAPVLLGWHGFGSRPEWMLRALKPDTHWRDAIVIAPYGEGRSFEQFGDAVEPGWQVSKGELDDRDLKLFDAIMGQLQDTGCGDLDRVYTTGFSNGGFFSNVLACHRADEIAAAAPTGGGGPFVKGCGDVPAVLITHGRQDNVVPYASAEQTWSTWLGHAGCTTAAGPQGDACTRAEGCRTAAPIELCAFTGRHEWPAGHEARLAEFLRAQARG